MKVIKRSSLNALFEAIAARGYTMVGPVVRDQAIIYDEITSPTDLPVGWTDAQSQIKGKPGKAQKAAQKAKSAKSKPSEPKKATKLSFKDQHRLKEVEAVMPKLEVEIAELEAELSDPGLFNQDPDAFNRINTRLETARAELEQAELDWMEIEEKKEALAG